MQVAGEEQSSGSNGRCRKGLRPGKVGEKNRVASIAATHYASAEAVSAG